MASACAVAFSLLKILTNTQEGRMFTDRIELKDFDKMDPEYKDLLSHGVCQRSIGGLEYWDYKFECCDGLNSD